MSVRKFDRMMVAIELGSNPKIGRLTDAQFRCLLCGVWPLAAKASPRGYLVIAGSAATPEDVAYQARCSASVARGTLDALREMGMVETDAESGMEFCRNWWDLNPDPKHDPTNAERQRRYRNGRNAPRNAPVTVARNAEVTLPEVEERRKEKETSSLSAMPTSTEPAPVPPEVVQLCLSLAGWIEANDDKAKPNPSSQKWLADMRLLLKDRDGDVREVQRIIDWCQADAFWRSNILSPGKLRKQFSQLLLKSKGSATVTDLRSSGQRPGRDLPADHQEALDKAGVPAYELASRGHEWRHLIPETEGAA